VAEGLPLTVTLTIVDKAGCKPLPGATVYLWQCDINGAYSLYSQGVTADNYLRGVQVADASGQLSFLTVFPGAYVGRWPHIHFEVFANAASATSGRNARATSQLALPEDICRLVYATPAYAASLRGLGQSTLQSDNVFRDGWTTQMPTLTGNTTAGYEAKLSVAV
jgi:protocatechuate 3,4-dioxygenase beta subunit